MVAHRGYRFEAYQEHQALKNKLDFNYHLEYNIYMDPVITYKKSRNLRVAKVWDTSYLYSAMVQSAQIKQDIEKASVEMKVPIADLGNTVVPTHMLWFIVDTYLDAYKMLMKESLIKTGNIHKVSPTIN